MDRLETYKDFYQKELDRKSQLNNDLSIPIGLISLLATGIFFYLTNFGFTGDKIIDYVFCFLLLLGSFCLIKSIYYLLKSYLLLTKSVEYDFLAYPNEIEKYFQAYKKYCEDLGHSEDESSKKAQGELENYFIAAYIRTSTKNMSINDVRSTNLYRCKKQILFSLITLLVAFLPYIFDNFTKKEKIPKVEISNKLILNCDSCLNNLKNTKMAALPDDTTSQSNPQPPPPPPPPTPPDDRHVKEGVNPAKPKS